MGTHNLCFGAKNKKNMYTPTNPSFAIVKVGFKGVYITRTCFRDVLLEEVFQKNEILKKAVSVYGQLDHHGFDVELKTILGMLKAPY